MVVLMNLDESGVDDPLDKLSRLRNSSQHITHGSNTEPEDLKSGELETSRNPNLLSTFAAALSCYP